MADRGRVFRRGQRVAVRRKTRKDWHRLLGDLDQGLIDVIITWEPSRADRDLETWVAFVAKCRARGVLIHITGEDETLDARTPSHWHRLIEGGLDAAMESEKISKRTRRGVAAAAVAGAFHGDCPYGYERVIVGERPTRHGPKPIREQRPHPVHADVVREIFERGRNDPIIAIMKDLNGRGVLAPASDAQGQHLRRAAGRDRAAVGTADRRRRPTDRVDEGADDVARAAVGGRVRRGQGPSRVGQPADRRTAGSSAIAVHRHPDGQAGAHVDPLVHR
jgi:DNA invertase Pin-like site-specific DNA recombinase